MFDATSAMKECLLLSKTNGKLCAATWTNNKVSVGIWADEKMSAVT